jgi:hypothetical protein
LRRLGSTLDLLKEDSEMDIKVTIHIKKIVQIILKYNFEPLLLLGPPFFPIVLLGSGNPVIWDDRHLLAHAMTSDFSRTAVLL